ncbi:MAG: hypothetical protein AAF088_09605 [Pseudomonadota bacterium]
MRFPKFLISAAIFAALTGPAFAAGSDDSKPPRTTKTTLKCERGQIYDRKTKSCLDAKSEAFSDQERYDAVRELAYANQFDRAQMVIAAADMPQDPRFLNYMGFINRKQGNMGAAMEYYQAALSIDPDYILARSYMGQGLLSQGDKIGATTQLREIAARGGRETWAYAALEQALYTGSHTY